MCSGNGDAQNLAQTTPQMLIVSGGKLQGEFWTNDPEMMIGTCRSAMQQHHPSRLHIKQQCKSCLVFTGRLLQIRSHEFRVALFVGGQPRTPPHASTRVDHFCCPLQSCANRRFHAELIPHVCVVHVDPNVSMAEQILFKTGVWLRRDVHIIEIGEQFFVHSQLLVTGLQSWMLAQREQQWHQCIPLFSSTLVDGVHCALRILPKTRGGRPENMWTKESSRTTLHICQSLQGHALRSNRTHQHHPRK